MPDKAVSVADQPKCSTILNEGTYPQAKRFKFTIPSYNMTGAREAYVCLGGDTESLNSYDPEKAAESAIVKDAVIEITPEEERLFHTLEQAAIAYEQKTMEFHTRDHPNVDLPTLTKPIEIRIAGGWVRDKIMRQSSHDVDIALDSMSGHQFAIIVQQYLIHSARVEAEAETKAETEANSKRNEDTMATAGSNKRKNKKQPKIAVIAANPSQSKHLETATMRIHQIDCDFVHLRGGEVYTSDSRIPTLKQDATPLDDALRRDFTVNALFYNMRRRHVEDWTGRGIDDLTNRKLLVTPLDARVTFHDDPLRVLRAIRFAVRYDLTLSEEISAAAMSPEVHESLHVKVSRERVGKELEGMLTGKNAKPSKAMKLITELKLAGCVFEFPHNPKFRVEGKLQGMDYATTTDEKELRHARETTWEEAADMLRYCAPLLQVIDGLGGLESTAHKIETKVDHRIFYLTSFLYPLRNMAVIDAKGKESSLVLYIIRESIKYKNKDTQSVNTILAHVDEMRSVLTALTYANTNTKISSEESSESPLPSGSTFCRLRVGLLLRNLKDLWVTAILVATIAEMHSTDNLDGRASGANCTDDIKQKVSSHVTNIANFVRVIQQHGLDECWKVRPILDGKAIFQILNLPRGPTIGAYLQEQIKWMLLNPNGSKVECETHLKAIRKRELEIQSVSSSSVGDEGAANVEQMKSSSHCSKKAHVE